MMKQLCVILWLSIILLANACWREAKPTATEIDFLKVRLDSIGQSFIAQQKTGAISIAVVDHDRLIYNQAFGYANLEQQTPITAQHYFNMASISKLVGAVMTMKLVEEGVLNLDQPLSQLLPEFPNKQQAEQITLRHLLAHTSGLMDYAILLDTVFMESGKVPTRQDYMDFFQSNKLLFKPGDFYAYTNSGFKLMEFIIERASGRSFIDEIDRIINKPAGINIKLIKERIDDPLMTEALDYTDTTLNQEIYWSWISGDGGMTATSADLAHFAQKWSDGSLISDASFKEMTSPYRLNSGLQTGYGLGVRTGYFEGEYAIGHTGGNKSAMAMMMYFPEKDISIAVFDNTDGSPTSAMTVMGYVALAVLDKVEPVHQNIQLSESLKESYLGSYDQYDYVTRTPDRLEVYFNHEDQHLYRKYEGSESQGQKLIALGNDLFATEPYVMDRVQFVRDSSGDVIAFRNYWNGLYQRMGYKVL